MPLCINSRAEIKTNQYREHAILILNKFILELNVDDLEPWLKLHPCITYLASDPVDGLDFAKVTPVCQ